ncbi:capsule biosynthesis protein [Tropicimonas sp. S265A]|uniref:capsule biosynthesis protein n=1 Tax=Tropicimonas sp. S265A TaxID=3415134 RepID=UPI003C7CFF78
MKPTVKKFRIRRSDVANSLARQTTAPQAKAQQAAAQKPAADPASKAAPGPRTTANPAPAKPASGNRETKADAKMQTAMNAAKTGPAPNAKPKRPAQRPQAGAGQARPKADAKGAPTDADILAEGLTGRQLRIARRVALRHGLKPETDLDAVRMLRAQGIDPFTRDSILDLVADKKKVNLPTTVPDNQVPAPQVQTEADIAREVEKIQKGIAQRRRRRVGFLAARLAAFVFLPTLVAGIYYFLIATPMFATHSEFIIQQADAQSAGAQGGFGGILGAGGGLATTQDAVTVQSYLTSREAMLRLNEDHGFKDHFSSPEIDFLQRLAPDASNEDAFKLYKDRVIIGFDPTEGIVKMEVIAATPEVSHAFSTALISYAEEQVDNLTQRLREDQMSGARESYEDAENKVRAAQERVLELQETRGVLSADLEASSQMQQISTFETQLNLEKLRLQELLQNASPNSARATVVAGNIERLEALISQLRAEMTDGVDGQASLARVSGELVIAQADLETRQSMLSQSLQQLEMARIEANRQVRYLSLGVRPIAPDEASYPRALENTFLAFLVFAGIYLMVSLTASVLREQVSG